MKIILNENMENLGSVGDILEVRDGYARNFLVPNGWAVEATPSNVKVIEQSRAKEIQKEREHKATAEDLAKRVRAASVIIEAVAGDEGKLFGSVTNAQVQEVLAAQGLELDKKQILINKPIRQVGNHDIEVRCYTSVKAPLRVVVVEKKDPKQEAKRAEKKALADKADKAAEVEAPAAEVSADAVEQTPETKPASENEAA